MYDRDKPPRWFSLRLVEGRKGLEPRIDISEPGTQWLREGALAETPAFKIIAADAPPFGHICERQVSTSFGFGGVGTARKRYEGATLGFPLMEPEKRDLVSKTLSALQLVISDPPDFSARHLSKYKHFQTATLYCAARDGFRGRNIEGVLTADGVRRLRALSQDARNKIAAQATETIRRVWNKRSKEIETMLADVRKLAGDREEVQGIDTTHWDESKITDNWFLFACPGAGLPVQRRVDETFEFLGHNIDNCDQQMSCLAGFVVMCQALDKVP